jgi:glycolate oxidase
MRRMDAIVEIDEQNMYAVVEPYVIAAQLQAEILPLGLNLNIPGVGCSSSIVASACAYHGAGPDTYYMGGNAENLLGMEWVTPEGEIVRTGSLGSGDGWFCSEGPGPSVRGICRGTIGSRGGLGVYTKCAVKLAPHFGQTEWNVEGTLPAYRLPVHENLRVHTLAVPDWDAWAEIYYKIYDNEIGYIFHRQFNLAGADLAPAFWLTYNDATKTLSDVPAMVADPEVAQLTEEMRISFQLILAGRSTDDIELQDRILDAILEEVGGWKVERFCEQDMAEFTNVYLQRLGHKHINFVWAGGYIGSWMQFGTPDWVKGYIPTAAAGLERDAAGGKLVQCGGDAMMGSGSGIPLGGATGLEQFVSYDPDDYESTVAGIKHMEDAVKDAASISYPPGK